MTGKTKTTVGALAILALAVVLFLQNRDIMDMREQNRALRQELSEIQESTAALSNRVEPPESGSAPERQQLRELLRLRSELGLLRQKNRELEEAASAARRNSAAPPETTEPTREPDPTQPAPFQLQLVLDQPGDDAEAMTNSASGSIEEPIYLQKKPLMDYSTIQSAVVSRDSSSGAVQVEVQFNDAGRELFADITKEHINQRLAIVLDGRLYAAPLIRSEISNGKAQITGSFTEEEAGILVAKINEAIARRQSP